MRNESPVVIYLQEVLGIRSFIRSAEVRPQLTVLVETPTSAAEVAEPRAIAAANQKVAPRLSSTLQFVVDYDLPSEEHALATKMMTALGVPYEVKNAEDAGNASTFLLWGKRSKEKFGFHEAEMFVWREQNGVRYFLGCELKELLGANAQVTSKKKQIWTELQCLKN